MIPWVTYVVWAVGYLVLLAVIVFQGRALRRYRRAQTVHPKAVFEHIMTEGFQFAARLPDPEFRTYVEGFGFRSGEKLYPVHPAEPLGVVLDRVHDRNERGWLVLSDPAAPFGVVLFAVGERR